MIQRIQSLWLLLASLSCFLLFFSPVATFMPNPECDINAKELIFKFFAYRLDYELPFSEILDGLYAPFLQWTVVVVVLVCILTPFFAIFMYKSRMRQMQLSRLTILLNIALTVSFFLLSDFFAEGKCVIVRYSVGIYVPIAAVVFLLLAIRFIKKDDKLVRSADRIR